MTPQEIIDDSRELFMNTPEGYPFAQRINQRDVSGLKGFLINTTPDEHLQQVIRDMSHLEIVESMLSNNFTFDEQWLGARLHDWQKERG